MAGERKDYERKSADQRQNALIEAAIKLIAEGGPDTATVRAIAEAAGVTQGLIRHYFSSKEALVSSAYERHMDKITAETFAVLKDNQAAPIEQLRSFIIASLTPPVVDTHSMALWAGFMNTIQRYPSLNEVHQRSYFVFRDRLQSLISAAWAAEGVQKSKAQERQAAIACNALIDGLWIEGGALPASFEAGELPEIGLQSLQAILGLDLSNTETRNAVH